MRPRPGETPRFRFVQELGRGGMGSVELVWDELREEEIARKRCRIDVRGSAGQRALGLLKREFRATAELRHPSLVPVYELGEDADGVFFTMQAVDGVDLYRWCRRDDDPAPQLDAPTATGRSGHAALADTEVGAPPSEVAASSGAASLVAPDAQVTSTLCIERLAAVLPSLLEGLAYLHARGLVHRDLKPGNVMVDRGGRARILDFGVLAELVAPAGEIAGTPTYMAPEQIRGARATTAMDLYALGITLFELAAGRPPFTASSTDAMFERHLHAAAPRLTDVVPGVHGALDDAVARLLDKDPDARPPLATLATTLLPAIGAEVPVLEPSARPAGDLVGRELLQVRIADRLESDSTFSGLVLEGPSGVGKTALARWAAERARSLGWAVLQGRARPTELLAFNAIDGVVDDLSHELAEQVDAPELLVDRQRAAIAFPILGDPARGPLADDARRAVAFGGVARLLGALADDRDGVLVIVDDLQWADADSLSFLDALATAAPAGVRLLATCRDDLPRAASSEQPSDWVDRQRSLLRLEVPPLDHAAIGSIVAATSGRDVDAETARRIAEECGGRPYLAEVAGYLARQESPPDSPQRGPEPAHLARALTERLRALPPTTHALLGALAAAEGWLSAGDLADGLGDTLGAVDAVARSLGELAVIRRTGTVGRDEQLDLYHDVARVAVIETVGEHGVRRGHEVLADLLRERSPTEPLRLIHHLSGAGRIAEAARHAEIEARRAERRRAYGLSARLYALAADGMPERAWVLGRARAIALIRGGLYEAAVAQIEQLDARDADERADLTFDRAYALLMGGDIGAGRRALEESLLLRGQRKLARPGVAMVRDAIRLAIGPVAPGRPRDDGDANALHQREMREREAEIALLLTWEDPIAGLSWALRCRALADLHGRPERGAFADYVLAFAMVGSSGRAGDSAIAGRYLRSARSRASAIAADPSITALDGAVEALADFRRGEFRRASEAFTEIARDHDASGRGQTHTHLLLLSNSCGALMCAERPRELDGALARFVAACPPSAGAMEAHVLVVQMTLAEFQGNRADYRQARNRLRTRRAADGEPLFSHLVGEVLGSHGELYWGDPVEARRNNAEASRAGRVFRMHKTYFAGAFAAMNALVEVAALRAGDAGASPRRIARWATLARRAPPIFNSGAVRAEAYAADHAGRPDRAVALLREAETMASRYDNKLSRAIARYQLGRRVKGDEGAGLTAAAHADLDAIGASPILLDEDRGPL